MGQTSCYKVNEANSSHLEQVVIGQNGEVYNPMDIEIESVIVTAIFCSIGIPLNVSAAIPVIRLRRLNRKPRNIFLLAIILSYLSFFIPPVIELIYWGLYPDQSLCHAYVAVVAIPQGLLLTNMLLALIERYMAINHPLLHKRKMTTKFAWILVISCSMLTVFILKFVYITQLGTLRCEVWHPQMKLTAIVLAVLFLPCMTTSIVIYRLTKILLCESRTLEATPDNRHLSSSNPFSNATPAMSVHVGRRQLSQMGMEATRNLVIGVSSLCISPCIILVIYAYYFVCQLSNSQLECSNILGMRSLIKNIILTPAIYGVIIFLVRYKELRAAWACQIFR